MNTSPLILGFLAQALSVQPAALEKRLLDIFLKIDDTLRNVEAGLSALTASLPAPPARGGGGTPGAAAPAGATPGSLLPPALLTVLPPLQTLDMAFGALLEKMEPGIRACLQLQEAAEKAINSSEALTVALDAMAVTQRGVGNLLATGRVDGGAGRQAGLQAGGAGPEAGQAAPPPTTAATGLPRHNPGGAPGPAIIGAKDLGPRPMYYSGASEADPTTPAPGRSATLPAYAPQVADNVATGILDYLARFEPLIKGINDKSADCLRYVINMDNNLGRAVARGMASGGDNGVGKDSSVTSELGDTALDMSGNITAGLLASSETTAPFAGALAALLAIGGLFLKFINSETYKEMEDYKRNMRYNFLNKFYVEENPNYKEPVSPAPQSRNIELVPPLTPLLSPLDAIPPQVLSNVTNNSYDNCNNKNVTITVQDTSPEAFARGLKRELRDVVRNFDSGMHV